MEDRPGACLMKAALSLTAGAPIRAFVSAVALVTTLTLLFGHVTDLLIALSVEVAWAVGVVATWLALLRVAHVAGAEDPEES